MISVAVALADAVKLLGSEPLVVLGGFLEVLARSEQVFLGDLDSLDSGLEVGI